MDHAVLVSLPVQAAPLQYFTAVMGICEELGSAAGSARFAQTALQHVEAAFPGGAASEQRSQQASRLWAAIFVQRLEADRPQVRQVLQPGAGRWQVLQTAMACFGSWLRPLVIMLGSWAQHPGAVLLYRMGTFSLDDHVVARPEGLSPPLVQLTAQDEVPALRAAPATRPARCAR